MNTDLQVFADLPQAVTIERREILYRTGGRHHGSVTRLVSPGDLGKLIKPFIFLDHFDLMPSKKPLFGMHPHSGIATLTVILSGQLDYEDTTGKRGTLPPGGVEWMNAGNGVWHTGGPAGDERVQGFQLWVALPPEDENGAAYSQYLAPSQIESEGPARVVLGRYGKASSPIRTRASINYLHVRLKDGEQWTYTPPPGHDVAWVAVASGLLRTSGSMLDKEIAVYEASSAPLHFSAKGDTEFVLGSAVPHPHDLITGYYSVHTNEDALARGEAEIQRIGALLQKP